MKYRPIGIISDQADFMHHMEPEDFSNNECDCVQMRSGKNNNIVLIMRSKKPAPLNWKVVYGFSQMYFATFRDAVDFCESHSMKLVKG